MSKLTILGSDKGANSQLEGGQISDLRLLLVLGFDPPNTVL